MTDNEFKYWAFLSYSQRDTAGDRSDRQGVPALNWIDWLRGALETFSIPADFAGQINARGEIIPQRLDSIYQDQQEQPADAALSDEVRMALDQSKCLIVICSPHSAQSLHVNEAVRYFKQLGRGNRVLPIIVAGEPNASEGSKPGIASEEECFVPALRHPLKPDGTLDTAQRDRGTIFADARGEDGKQELLPEDRVQAETKLEIAKIQLIAGLIGVGFNGLWSREQQRRFVESQIQAREAKVQLQEARRQLQAAKNQLQGARTETPEAPGQPQEAPSEVEAAQRQAQAAQQQARVAQEQLLETQRQLEEVRSQLQNIQSAPPAAPSPAPESLAQIEAAQRQAQEAQQQARVAQEQLLETQRQLEEVRSQLQNIQSPPPAAASPAPESLAQIEAAQRQAQEAQQQARVAQGQLLETQRQLEEVRSQLQNIQSPPQSTPSPAPESLAQIEVAQSQVQEAQQQARVAQEQLLETQRQLEEVRSQLQNIQSPPPAAPSPSVETQGQLDAAQSQAQEAQLLARTAQAQLQEARRQLEELQSQLQQAQAQQQEVEKQARQAQDQSQTALNQVQLAQNQIEAAQKRAQEARRRTKVFALLAVLALMAASAASFAWGHRKSARPVLAKSDFGETREPDVAPEKMDKDQIQQALQKISGTWPDENRQRRQDELASRIPLAEIPDALTLSPLILDDQQRCAFQEKLVLRLGESNPLSAMTCASTVPGKIVNADGTTNACRLFQLAVLDNWIKTDLPAASAWVWQLADADFRERALEKIVPPLAAENPTNTLALLNHLQPAPEESSYALLFQRWATNDPVQAIQQRQQIPSQDANDQIFRTIIAAWVASQPEAAWDWLKAQPDSDSKKRAVEAGIFEQAKTDFAKALTQAETLLDGTWRDAVIPGLFNRWAAKDLDAATAACQQLPDGLAKEKAWACVLDQRIAKDPASAAAYVTNLPPGDYRGKAIAELCSQWSSANPPAGTNAPAAVLWAQGLPSEAERLAACNQAVAHWAQGDPQAALQFANQHPELSGSVLGEIAKAWAKTDLPAASGWVESLPDGEQKDAALLALAAATAESAPPVAAKLCALLTTAQPSPQQVQTIASALAKEDISGAVTWARGLKADATRQAAFSVLTEPWAQSDPQGLATYAIGLPAGDVQTRCLTAACQQLAKRDFPATVELLKPLADDALRHSILEQAARACDLLHLNQAAQYVAAMPAGDDQKAAITGLLASWTDPETALAWLASFPGSNAQPAQAQSVIKTWAVSEPAAAATWLINAPAGPDSEALAAAFLAGAVTKYPEYAAQWTQSVTNETLRQNYQLQVAREWWKTDPAAASNWVGTLSLPEAVIKPLGAQSP